jgi:CheY-like chemotaxis protein
MPKEKPSILIVEDRPNELAAYKKQFDSAGWDVACAGSLREGQHALRRNPDCVLCDMCLKKRNSHGSEGAELIQECRRVCPHSVIIGLSYDKDYRDDAIRAGAHDFLVKENALSPETGARVTSLEVVLIFQKHQEQRYGGDNAFRALDCFAMWFALPILVVLAAVTAIAVTGYHLPFAPPVFTVALPILGCILFLATIVVGVGRKDPILGSYPPFRKLVGLRNAIGIGALTALLGGAYYDFIKKLAAELYRYFWASAS